MIGETISHYRIVDKIGAGGMGVVYRAEDTKLHRTVALKFLPDGALGSDIEKTRFFNEARAAAGLSHPNICTVFEIDEVDGRTFISMEYIEGRSLRDIVQQGPLDIDVAVRYAAQVARGLEEAHSRGVVHRDVKSANVVVSLKGHAIVMDFGLAKLHGQTRVTQTGTTVGTLHYMSPEQARGDDVDHRTDIWSLGVVLYRMVVGRYPFDGEHNAAVMYAIMNERQKPLTAVRSDVPMALERIVDKALAKDPAERYQNLADMIVDLKAVRKESGTVGSPTASTSVPARPSMPGVRIGIAAVLVVVAALIAWWRFGGTGGDAPATKQAAGDGRVSIAVLPLDNMSGDDSKEYFADGMTEALIAELAQIRALRVISRTSVMRFKKTQQSIPEVAAALGVSRIIEGSVMQAGDRVRITAQLIAADTDEHLWAQSYERDASDVLALQSEVARAIASEVQVELTPEDAARLASHEGAVNKEAYDLYLRGRYHWSRRTPSDLDQALDYFQRAIAVDPGYADAYTGIAQTYVVLISWTPMPADSGFPLAEKYAKKALEIDPMNAEAWGVLAGVNQEWYWDWDRATEYYRKSLDLDPSDASVHQWYAEHLAQQGHFDDAFAEIQVAEKLDPLAMIVRTVKGFIMSNACRPEEAVAIQKSTIELDSTWSAGYLYQFEPYIQMGKDREAVAAYVKYLQVTERAGFADSLDAAYAAGGMEAFWDGFLDDLKARRSPALVGLYCAAAGRVDSALVYLERAYEERAWPVHIMASHPLTRSLVGQPRFEALLRKMHLEDVQRADCPLP